MASPQIENGYTKIANELLDVLMRHPEVMKGSLFQIIAVVWRKTYGWDKKEDSISISQFVEMTGLSKRTVIYALQELEAKNVLKIRKGSKGGLKKPNLISFNKDYETWVVQNSAPQVKTNRSSAKLRKLVVQNSVKSLHGFAHTKETITKEQQNNLESKNMAWKKYNEDGHFEEAAIDAETGLPTSTLKGKKKERAVDADVLAVFELFNNPAKALWRMRELERIAAQTLFEVYGLDTLKKRIARIEIEKQKKDPYFPEVSTPSQLLDKMSSVERYLGI